MTRVLPLEVDDSSCAELTDEGSGTVLRETTAESILDWVTLMRYLTQQHKYNQT